MKKTYLALMIECKGGGQEGKKQVEDILKRLYGEATEKYPRPYTYRGIYPRYYYVSRAIRTMFPNVFKSDPCPATVKKWLNEFGLT